MATAYLAIALLALALVAVMYRLFTLQQKLAVAVRDRDEKRMALARTSKLLIEKNMEMFDRNVRQQKQLESKEDFVGIVSHQLRTPATEVKWGIEALESELKGKKQSEQATEYLEKLRKSAERMVRLIDSLVRLMAVDEQYRRLSIAPYDPDEVIVRVAEDVAKRFEGTKKLNLAVTQGMQGGTIDSMDSDSLALVAENLIENAFTYTPEGGSVTVSTQRAPDGCYSFTIKDTGVGIPKDKQKMVFAKFQRSETAMRMNSGGMGLGLYLVKNIVERQDGRVSFESQEGAGSAFRVVLPTKRRLV